MPKRRGIVDYKSKEDNKWTRPYVDIFDERVRQEAKWGTQNHDQMIWLGILAEEFGEAATEINELHFRPGVNGGTAEWRLNRVRAELIQVAAVAVAMVESLDRNGK